MRCKYGVKSPRLATLFALFLSFSFLHAVRAQEAEKPFTSLEQLVDLLPPEMLKELRSRNGKETAKKATELLQEKVKGKSASLDLKMMQAMPPVAGVSEAKPSVIAYDDFRKSGLSFAGMASITFTDEDAPKAAKVKKGTKIHVDGKIKKAMIFADTRASVQVVLIEAKLRE